MPYIHFPGVSMAMSHLSILKSLDHLLSVKTSESGTSSCKVFIVNLYRPRISNQVVTYYCFCNKRGYTLTVAGKLVVSVLPLWSRLFNYLKWKITVRSLGD